MFQPDKPLQLIYQEYCSQAGFISIAFFIICQSLALARIHLSVMKKSVSDEKGIKRVDDIFEIVLKSLQNIKNIIFDLSFPVMDEIGLEGGISSRIEKNITSKLGINVGYILKEFAPEELLKAN